MKKFLLVALMALMLPLHVHAQSAVQQPLFAAPRAILDLGNGPLEIKMTEGSAGIFTSQGTAVSTTVTASTTMTLVATPPVAPCVGCSITGTGIPAGTTIATYNGATGITLSQAATVANNAPVQYGAACPAANAQSGNPPPTFPVVLMQAANAGFTGDLPLYTTARICAAGLTGPGGQMVTFAIGQH